MEFQYRGRDRSGQLREGTVTAAGRTDALATLQQKGLLISHLDAVTGLNLNLKQQIHLGEGPVRLRELATFCGQFGVMIGSGVPVTQALAVLSRQFRGRRLGRILTAVIVSIEGGGSLSQAMRAHRAHLPPSLLYITAVAEVTGELDQSYALLARQFEQEDDFQRKVGSALAYPKVVMMVAMVVILFMVTFVLPTYGNMFSAMGATLPGPTRVLMALGVGIKDHWFLGTAALLLVWWAVRWLLTRPQVQQTGQNMALRVPVVGALLYKRELSGLCRTIGTMIQSGVPLMAALRTTTQATQFLPVRAALAGVHDRLQQGDSLGRAMGRQAVFDRISVQMITLGEASGNLAPMLQRAADMAEKDVGVLLGRLTAVIEPAMTLVLGLAVLGIIIPMLLPMFDILGQVR